MIQFLTVQIHFIYRDTDDIDIDVDMDIDI